MANTKSNVNSVPLPTEMGKVATLGRQRFPFTSGRGAELLQFCLSCLLTHIIVGFSGHLKFEPRFLKEATCSSLGQLTMPKPVIVKVYRDEGEGQY